MNTKRIEFPSVGSALLALTFCASALAADKAVSLDAQARYRQERAACMNGQTNQDRVTCLREAGAAFAQTQRERVHDGPTPYESNARQRCEGLPTDDRQACVARMQGQGTTSGSAASGGIFRELVTREGAVPSPAPSASVPQDAEPNK